MDWRLLVKGRIVNIGVPIYIFGFFKFQCFFAFKFFSRVFWSLQTSLLCIMEELAGGGYVAVAVAVSDR